MKSAWRRGTICRVGSGMGYLTKRHLSRYEGSERRVHEGFRGSILPREVRVSTKLRVRAQGIRRVVRKSERWQVTTSFGA